MEEHFIVRLVILRIANTRSDLMREVLFRGKRITDGEWCEGNLFIDEKGEKHEILLGYTNYRIAWEVIPSTIGQYTGLTDKNGKKIFEGDILKWQMFINDVELSYKDVLTRIDEVVYKHISFQLKNNSCSLCVCDDDMDVLEVIGNIHDNPELLRSDQQ